MPVQAPISLLTRSARCVWIPIERRYYCEADSGIIDLSKPDSLWRKLRGTAEFRLSGWCKQIGWRHEWIEWWTGYSRIGWKPRWVGGGLVRHVHSSTTTAAVIISYCINNSSRHVYFRSLLGRVAPINLYSAIATPSLCCSCNIHDHVHSFSGQ